MKRVSYVTDRNDLLASQIESARASLFAATVALETVQALLAAENLAPQAEGIEEDAAPQAEETLAVPEVSNALRDQVFGRMGSPVTDEDWEGIDLRTMGQE
jgi:hypothetical protein